MMLALESDWSVTLRRVRHCWLKRRHFDAMITVWIIGDILEIWRAALYTFFMASDRVQKVAITRGIKSIGAMPGPISSSTGKLRDERCSQFR